MILKVLMCACYKEEFQAESHTYVKKLIHFHCKCKEKHFCHVLFCNEHSFGADFAASTEENKKCSCKNGLSHEVCCFRLTVRYLLNFKCFKICMEEVPDNFIDRVISMNQYFKKINCEPFFKHKRLIWLRYALIILTRKRFLPKLITNIRFRSKKII